MTETEMYLIGDLLYRCGKYHVVFDERTDDKRVLPVSSDVPTTVRYILASPLTTPVIKMFAENSLKRFMSADSSVSDVQHSPFENDNRVLYCAPDLGQPLDTKSPGSPCCDSIYHAADTHGDLYRAHCTRMATTRIRVTVSDGAYVAKVCARCAEDGVKSAGMEGNPLAIEILGEFK